MSTKVEIRLAKAEIVTWAALEYGKGQTLLPKPNVASGFFFLNLHTFLLQFISEDTIFVFILLVPVVKPTTPYSYVTLCSYAAVSQRPVYPSSKPGKDWDKLEAEVKKQVPLLAPQAWLYFYFILFLLIASECAGEG